MRLYFPVFSKPLVKFLQFFFQNVGNKILHRDAFDGAVDLRQAGYVLIGRKGGEFHFVTI